jgi:hypothetical protein
MKKKIHTVRAVPKKNMIERGKIDFPNKKKAYSEILSVKHKKGF